MTSVPRIPSVTFGRRTRTPLPLDGSHLVHRVLRSGACEQRLADLFRAMESKGDAGRDEGQRDGPVELR